MVCSPCWNTEWWCCRAQDASPGRLIPAPTHQPPKPGDPATAGTRRPDAVTRGSLLLVCRSWRHSGCGVLRDDRARGVSRPSTPSSSRCPGRSAPGFVSLARLFVDDRTAAEDLVQEAFIQLARNAYWIRDEERAAAYLRSIVINLARDHNRRGLVSFRHRPPAAPDAPSAEEHAPRPRSGGRWSKRCERCPNGSVTASRCGTTSSLDPRHRGNAWRVGELGQDTPAARTAVHGPDPGGEAMSARRPFRRGRAPRPA